MIKPDHLIDQAFSLVTPAAGAPRQVNLRRALSSAYYALFHEAALRAADSLVGAAARSTPRYHLVYRSLSHSKLKEVCDEIVKSNIRPKYHPYLPRDGRFCTNIEDFAEFTSILQSERHRADYNPAAKFKFSAVHTRLVDARQALHKIREAIVNPTTSDQVDMFFGLMLFDIRT